MEDELDRWAARAHRRADRARRGEAVAELKARAAARGRARAGAATPAPARAAARGPRRRGAGDRRATALWAYCVARDDAALADGGPGVHPDGESTWLRDGGLALLVSRVPLAEFGEEPLRRNLNEFAWLERVARAHEAVIGAALGRRPVVPLAALHDLRRRGRRAAHARGAPRGARRRRSTRSPAARSGR